MKPMGAIWHGVFLTLGLALMIEPYLDVYADFPANDL